MPQDSTQEWSGDDHEKNLFRPLIKLGYDVEEMTAITKYSPATIYRRFGAWGWVRGWIELDPPANAPPAATANAANAPPANASASAPPPTTAPGDLLTPEIRAPVEALRRKSATAEATKKKRHKR